LKASASSPSPQASSAVLFMSDRGNPAFLQDIAEAISAISLYIKDFDYLSFLKDGKTRDAVVRNLEIIGEAAKNIRDPFKKMHPALPWKEMAGVRDKLIHQYFGINYEVVWTIASQDLPALQKSLKLILKELKKINL
jgi:uncharacterized protein with HEPN domain